jgi:hypothetical protein
VGLKLSILPDSEGDAYSIDVSDMQEPSLGVSQSGKEGRAPLVESNSEEKSIIADSDKSHFSSSSILSTQDKENVNVK